MLCVFHCNYECYIIINIEVYERRKVYTERGKPCKFDQTTFNVIFQKRARGFYRGFHTQEN